VQATIIAVGTELLLGEVVNSNAAWLSVQLAQLGIDVYHHATVGDNPARIGAVVDEAISRFDSTKPTFGLGVLLFSGGLGPTPDDLTVQTLADHFQTPMVLDAESEATIKAMFIARGQPMAPTNIKQALRPVDAQVLPNPLGTAPGIIWNVGQKETVTGHTSPPLVIITFPGVPSELKAMWPEASQYLQTQLLASGQAPQVLVSRTLHFFGMGESMLASHLHDVMTADGPVTVAPYVGRAQVRLRLATKASIQAEANALLDKVEATITQRVGEFLMGNDDLPPELFLPHKVGQLLTQKRLTVAVAESCTGGLISSRLTDVAGSSAYVGLNVVTYSNAAKTQLLGVAPSLLAQHGAVSGPVAQAMAEGVSGLAPADSPVVGLSITGIAGPGGGSQEKPVGTAYIAVSGLTPQPVVHSVLVSPKNPRPEMKFWFSQYALFYLLQYIRTNAK
jgi:nicotinamide-nucleotide amidase